MATSEKRRFPRVESANLSFVYLDKNNQVIDRGTGKTRNISEGGFLIETDLELKNKYSVIASIELPEEVVELQGVIVHSTRLAGGKYLAGVMIEDISRGAKPLWKRFIEMLLTK